MHPAADIIRQRTELRVGMMLPTKATMCWLMDSGQPLSVESVTQPIQ